MPRLRSNESPSGAFKRQSGLAQARWRGLAPTSSGSFQPLCVRNLIAIYNDPLGYADLILNGDPEEYLKNATGNHGLEI